MIRASAFVLAMLVLGVALSVPAAAGPPQVGLQCVWIMNGPTLFSRVCVDPKASSCNVYTERWTWEGGYHKTCVTP